MLSSQKCNITKGATILFGMGCHKYPKIPRQYFCDPLSAGRIFYDSPPYPGANIFVTSPSPLKKIGASFNDWLWATSYAGWTT